MKPTNCNGTCICVHCNMQIPHTQGKPCRENDCPQCGKKMMREGSYHHQLYLSKKGESKESLLQEGGFDLSTKGFSKNRAIRMLE